MTNSPIKYLVHHGMVWVWVLTGRSVSWLAFWRSNYLTIYPVSNPGLLRHFLCRTHGEFPTIASLTVCWLMFIHWLGIFAHPGESFTVREVIQLYPKTPTWFVPQNAASRRGSLIARQTTLDFISPLDRDQRRQRSALKLVRSFYQLSKLPDYQNDCPSCRRYRKITTWPSSNWLSICYLLHLHSLCYSKSSAKTDFAIRWDGSGWLVFWASCWGLLAWPLALVFILSARRAWFSQRLESVL